MKLVSRFLAVSLAANVALAILFVVGPRAAPPVPSAPVVAPAVPPPPLTSAAWKSLQPDDLPSLAARLHAAGFPVEDVQVIVRARVHRLFGPRRQALAGPAATAPFWQAPAAPEGTSPAALALDREERAALRAALGADADVLLRDGVAAFHRQLPGIPVEKMSQLGDLVEIHDDRIADINASSSGHGLPLDAAEKTAAADRAFHDGLAALLTPTELDELELRISDTADSLRDNLSAFNPTEQEFRALFKLQQAFDLKYGAAWSPRSADESQARAADQAQLDESIHSALGDARFADYQRTTDEAFQSANGIVARLGLPADTTLLLWSLQKDIQRRASAIVPSPDDPAATRQKTALLQEAKAKISSALGAAGWEAYRQASSGLWLRTME